MKRRSNCEKHGMHLTPEYRAWASMIQRCCNPNNAEWHNYGGRGITVCEAWKNSFLNFFEYVGKKPSSKHSLDRIDNMKHYEPFNVRWTTKTEQAKNRRSLLGVSQQKYIYPYFNRFRVAFKMNQQFIHIGYFSSLEEAIKIRDELLS